MSIDYLSGPIIHVSVSALLAILFRLNLVVTVFYGILPDLVDTPLALCGIAHGRYIGHSLLFAVLAIAVVFLWRRKHVWAAVVGITSHILLDLNALIPWFFPFKGYDFPDWQFSLSRYLDKYLTLSGLGWEALIMLLATIVLLVYLRIRYKKARMESRED